MLSPAQIAENLVGALQDKKAKDIVLLKTDKLTVMADYFVICTAGSPAQSKTLTEECDKRLSDLGEPPLRREGYRSGGWVLLDFGSVILHIFMPEEREFYALERLWSDAETRPIDNV